jgi:hypothetical protein
MSYIYIIYISGMTRLATTIILLMLTIVAKSQDVIYDKSDSMMIEQILHEESVKEHRDTGELILDIAGRFIGCDYVAGTLENGADEPLYVSTTRLDCSTFVELVTAIAISIEKGDTVFESVCSNLERIRYRNGERKGYDSRLHYTSWWIEDNISKGIIKEITGQCKHEYRTLDLNFMSTHPDKYPMLEGNTAMQNKIEELEIPYRGIRSSYIPKQLLDKKNEISHIANGDIIALVTTIAGLDIAHVGFAYWKNGKLHMLHASSGRGKVIKDQTTLFDYMKNRSKQPGIRVMRRINQK